MEKASQKTAANQTAPQPERANQTRGEVAFAETWLRTQPNPPTEKTFLELAGLAAAQRDEVVLAMHKRYGNRFVAEQLAAAEVAVSASAPLPHAERIQQAFGKHDVGDIRVVIGGVAATTAAELGTTAFATHERIGFASAPDLYTAAHEAAHVVQQRKGRAPAGVGPAGGVSEQEADAVAARVVEGGSAEALLDGGVHALDGGAGGAAIQRDGGQRIPKSQPPWEWLAEKDTLDQVMLEVRYRIKLARLPQPHPRLALKSSFLDTLAADIDKQAHADPALAMKFLWSLVVPHDLYQEIQEGRLGPVGSKLDSVKHRIAAAFDEPLVVAITRMGARAVVQWDRKPTGPDGNEIVPSCPLDAYLARYLADPKLVTYTKAGAGAHDDTGGKPFLYGAYPIEDHWEPVGKTDVNLWNWIKVTKPNARAEDVAISMFDGKMLGAELAFQIAASPPFFGLPEGFVRTLEPFSTYKPLEVEARLHKEQVDEARPDTGIVENSPTEHHGVGSLAASGAADDAALAQAPKPFGQLTPAHALDRAHAQADDMMQQLDRFGGANLVMPARYFLSRRSVEESKDPKSLQKWAGQLEAQEAILRAASGELRQVIEELTARDKDGKQVMSNDLITQTPATHNLLVAYAAAGAVSHLHSEAPAALADARRQHTMLALTLADSRIDAARESTVAVDRAEQSRAIQTDVHDNGAVDGPHDLVQAEQDMQDLKATAARGDALDPVKVDKVATDASEIELRGRIAALGTSLRDLRAQSKALGMDTGVQYGGFYTIDEAVRILLTKIDGPEKDIGDGIPGNWLERMVKAHDDNPSDQSAAKFYKKPVEQIKVERRKGVIASVEKEYGDLSEQMNWKTFFKSCQDEIQQEKIKKIIDSVILQIGIAVVTGEAIGAVGAAIRGFMLVGEVGAELRSASLLWKGGQVIAEAMVNTGVQGAMGGPMDARAFAENALAIVLTSAAMKPFEGVLGKGAEVEQDIQSWGRTATRGGKLAAELVIETGAGIGAAGLAHAMTHGGEMGATDTESWVTMGLSIAASKFVGARTADMHTRLEVAAHEYSARDPNGPMAKNLELLSAKARKLEVDAAAFEPPQPGKAPKSGAKDHPPSDKEALELMRRRNELLEEERAIYAHDPTNNNAKTSEAAIEKELGDNKQLLEVPLRLANVAEVVPGHLYEGTAKQIEAGFAAADASGIQTTREWVYDHWKVTSGEKTVEIRELEAPGTEHELPNAAADAVRDSSFTGKTPKAGKQRTKIKQAEVEGGVKAAVDTLNTAGSKQKTRIKSASEVEILGANGKVVATVRFKVGATATSEVATFHYKKGANSIEVTVSPEARSVDLERAAAHELAEIHSLVTEDNLPTKDALSRDKGAASRMKLSGHDQGRLAELDVLLRRSKPTDVDAANELDALIKEMGFNPHSLEVNARARELLGEDRIHSIVETMTTREMSQFDLKHAPADAKATIDAEFEAAIKKSEKSGVPDSDRLDIRNAADLARARSKQPMPDEPEGKLAKANIEQWKKYCDYWAERAAELRSRFELELRAKEGDKAAKAEIKKHPERPEAMVKWEAYYDLRTPFDRGRVFEGKVRTELDGASVKDVTGATGKAGDETFGKTYQIEDQVGVVGDDLRDSWGKDDIEAPQRPDHMAIDRKALAKWFDGSGPLPKAIAFSDKSYTFPESMSSAAVAKTFNEHVAEAKAGYGGKVEIRSDTKFTNPTAQPGGRNSLQGQVVTVDKVIMVYDGKLIAPKHQAAIQKLAKQKSITVIFK